ncbi:unnamed protein product, partial [Ixodes persulcatus]
GACCAPRLYRWLPGPAVWRLRRRIRRSQSGRGWRRWFRQQLLRLPRRGGPAGRRGLRRWLRRPGDGRCRRRRRLRHLGLHRRLQRVRRRSRIQRASAVRGLPGTIPGRTSPGGVPSRRTVSGGRGRCQERQEGCSPAPRPATRTPSVTAGECATGSVNSNRQTATSAPLVKKKTIMGFH